MVGLFFVRLNETCSESSLKSSDLEELNPKIVGAVISNVSEFHGSKNNGFEIDAERLTLEKAQFD